MRPRRFRPRRSRRSGLRRWLIPVLLGFAAFPVAADYVNGWVKQGGACRVTRVVDGDTIAIACADQGATRLRLAEIDTPELRGQCLSERIMALRATWFTRLQLWTSGAVEVRAGRGLDPYGRALGDVALGGQLLSSRLLDAGLARPYVPGGTDWCASVQGGQA